MYYLLTTLPNKPTFVLSAGCSPVTSALRTLGTPRASARSLPSTRGVPVTTLSRTLPMSVRAAFRMSRSSLRRCALVVAGLLVAALLPVASAAVHGSPAAALPPDSMFQKVRLHTETGNPMAMDVAPDGRVFFIDRLGDIKIVQPNGATNTAAHLNVFTANESGGLNIVLDPGFATNQWVYVYYSPNSTSVDRLGRFTVNGNTIDLSTEKVVLDVPVQRAECCHHGGGLVFDK